MLFTIFKRIFSLLVCCCLVQFAHAQNGLKYSFLHYTTSNGLISNQINSLVQDEAGYIWMGTTDGLQRFDGVHYKSFRHKPQHPDGIPANIVQQLLLDHKNRLWLLFPGARLGIFDRHNFTFTEVKLEVQNETSLHTNEIRLVNDENGHLYLVLRRKEILTYNESSKTFSAKNNFFSMQPDWKPEEIIQQPGTKKLWISLHGGNLAIYDGNKKTTSFVGKNLNNEPFLAFLPPVNSIFGMHFDRKGRLWFMAWNTTYPELYCYDTKKDSLVLAHYNFKSSIKNYYETHEFFEQSDGTIWIRGSNLFGAYNEVDKQFHLVQNGLQREKGINFETITELMEDKEGNIWTGTNNYGLFRFNPAMEIFTNISHRDPRLEQTGLGSPMSFLPTKWGTILAGTWTDGLFQYDSNFNPVPLQVKGMPDINENSIWSMYASRDSNTIWLSAQPGFWRINQNQRRAEFFNPPDLNNRTVRQMVEDPLGNLWFGMQSIGLYKWDKKKGKPDFSTGIQQFPGIINTTINKVLVDSKGMIWVGTAVDGAFVIDPKTNNIPDHISQKSLGEMQVPESGVSAIVEYNDSIMILATPTRLLRFNRYTKKTTMIGEADQISGFISAMEKDAEGNIWVSTSNGLYRVNIFKSIFLRFNREDGLDNEQFSLAASQSLPDGRLVFGAGSQFVVFDPSNIRMHKYHHNLLITDIQVMNNSMNVDSILELKQLNLDYKDNSVSIEFSPMSFSNSYIVQYKMDGLDREWKNADQNNQAVYSYLPGGNYSFQIKTLNEEGMESATMVPFEIKIKPPFWKSWWFYSILLLGAATVLFLLDKERMNRKEAIHQTRSEIAGNLHHEVLNALNNINILSELARLKADSEPVKSKEFINQIHNKSFTMITSIDDMLWSIDPENDGMDKSMLRMKEYVESFNSHHGVQVELEMDNNIALVKAGMKFRLEAFLLFKETTGNVYKCGGKDLKIQVLMEKNLLVHNFQFNSDEIRQVDINQLFNGAAYLQRVKELHGTLVIDQNKHEALVRMKLPLA